MTGSPRYAGLFINLDRSPERRREIEAQLDAYNLAGRYSRFPAVDGESLTSAGTVRPGEAGCFHSHYQALASARDGGLPIHIIEDDVLLSEYLDGAARVILGSALFDRFDIVFTETFVHAEPERIAEYKRLFDEAFAKGKTGIGLSAIDLAGRGLACTSSYFVGPKSIGKVLAVLRAELDNGPTMALDMCYRQAVGQNALKIGCLFPFVTSIRLEHVMRNTIIGRGGQETNPAVMLTALLRYCFFVNRDLEGYAARFLAAITGEEQNAHRDFVSQLAERILSGRYRGF